MILKVRTERGLLHTHGGACACCSDVNVIFKTVEYHPLDDPISILDKYHSSNIYLSGAELEWLREDMGAISIFTKEIDSESINIKKLKNSKYDSTYYDVLIVEKSINHY